jgi:hypothetical protein
MLRDKKAISDVVVTILIVLISIIAVIVVWAAIRGYITKGAGEAGRLQDCLALNFEVKSAVYSSAANTTTVVVSRNVGGGAVSDLSFYKDNNIISTGIMPLGTNPPIEGTSVTYIISNIITKPDKIAIQPVIGNVTCPAVSADVQ